MPPQELAGAEVNNQSAVSKPDSIDKAFQEAREGMQNFTKDCKNTFTNVGKELSDEVNKVFGNIELFDSKKLGDAVKEAAVVIPSDEPAKKYEGFPHPEYKGEKGINRDVAPGESTVKAGDTLEKIAKEHLGPNASVAEVANHAKEIAKINGIDNPKMIHAGDKLKLPGHTKDGGFVTQDSEGNTLTQMQDGRLHVASKDGSKGYDRAPDGDGGYYEQGWGKQNEENYRLHHNKNGDVSLCDSDWKERNITFDSDREKLKYVRDRDNGK